MIRALWEAPTPGLRAVAIGVRSGKIAADFLYDGPIDDEVREIVSTAEAYLIADMPPTLPVQFQAVMCPTPFPRNLPGDLEWFYLRKED
jgi:hypothetical protein